MQHPQFELGQTTIGHLVDTVAEQFSDSKALEYHSPQIALTYDEFRIICNRVAKGLLALGIERGDHIAIWANNVPQWVLTQFGSGKMGAVLVTVNTNYRSFELEYLRATITTRRRPEKPSAPTGGCIPAIWPSWMNTGIAK